MPKQKIKSINTNGDLVESSIMAKSKFEFLNAFDFLTSLESFFTANGIKLALQSSDDEKARKDWLKVTSSILKAAKFLYSIHNISRFSRSSLTRRSVLPSLNPSSHESCRRNQSWSKKEKKSLNKQKKNVRERSKNYDRRCDTAGLMIASSAAGPLNAFTFI